MVRRGRVQVAVDCQIFSGVDGLVSLTKRSRGMYSSFDIVVLTKAGERYCTGGGVTPRDRPFGALYGAEDPDQTSILDASKPPERICASAELWRVQPEAQSLRFCDPVTSAIPATRLAPLYSEKEYPLSKCRLSTGTGITRPRCLATAIDGAGNISHERSSYAAEYCG
ncbi:hypothetical protein BDV98DRAFT_583598 [Pterulicium gracile]|uniref:Uncharacterized protein n=1 Tax=Pterulicium gracile TaxID=1884261 RepID=A0A5C3QIU3_9AGAR|nr:hypothetical protein BDV98DRAFT_583598 [Pterula gracilis]